MLPFVNVLLDWGSLLDFLDTSGGFSEAWHQFCLRLQVKKYEGLPTAIFPEAQLLKRLESSNRSLSFGPTSLPWLDVSASLSSQGGACPRQSLFISMFVQGLPSCLPFCLKIFPFQLCWPWCPTPAASQNQDHRKILSGRSFLLFCIGDLVPTEWVLGQKLWVHRGLSDRTTRNWIILLFKPSLVSAGTFYLFTICWLFY